MHTGIVMLLQLLAASLLAQTYHQLSAAKVNSAVMSLQQPHPKACLLPSFCLLCEQHHSCMNFEVNITFAPFIAANVAVLM